MELSLLPLAAILLLLSGASGRVPLTEGPTASAVLIRLWLTGDRAQDASCAEQGAGIANGLRSQIRMGRTAEQRRQARLASMVQIASRALNRTLLCGRFRVASAAFASTAPPQA